MDTVEAGKEIQRLEDEIAAAEVVLDNKLQEVSSAENLVELQAEIAKLRNDIDALEEQLNQRRAFLAALEQQAVSDKATAKNAASAAVTAVVGDVLSNGIEQRRGAIRNFEEGVNFIGKVTSSQ